MPSEASVLKPETNVQPAPATGKDVLGAFSSVAYTYKPKAVEDGDASFEATTTFKIYSDSLVMFEQEWTSGATGTTSNGKSWDEVGLSAPPLAF